MNTVDDRHDWGELQDDVEVQTTDETPDDGGSDPPREGESDPSEEAEMADETEYERQHQTTTDDSDDTTEESTDSDTEATAAAGTAIGGLALVGRVPWWAWVGLILFAFVLLVRRGDSDSPSDDAEEPAATPSETTAEWESDG